jgi:hypothetical protein
MGKRKATVDVYSFVRPPSPAFPEVCIYLFIPPFTIEAFAFNFKLLEPILKSLSCNKVNVPFTVIFASNET